MRVKAKLQKENFATNKKYPKTKREIEKPDFQQHFATQASGFDMCVKVNNKPKEIMLATNFLCTKTLTAEPNTKQPKEKLFMHKNTLPQHFP